MRDYETIETALDGRRDGPPRLLDAPHPGRDRDDQPHHLGLPAAPAEADPPAARRRAQGRHLAAPDAARRRPRPRAGRRGPDPRPTTSASASRTRKRRSTSRTRSRPGTSQYGMQTFDQSLYQLYKSGLITLEEALKRATNPNEFKLKIQGIQSTSDIAREEMDAALEAPSDFNPLAGGVALRLLQPAPGARLDAPRLGSGRSRPRSPDPPPRRSSGRCGCSRIRPRGRAELARALDGSAASTPAAVAGALERLDARGPARRPRGGALARSRRAGARYGRARVERELTVAGLLEGDDRRGARGGGRRGAGRGRRSRARFAGSGSRAPDLAPPAAPAARLRARSSRRGFRRRRRFLHDEGSGDEDMKSTEVREAFLQLLRGARAPPRARPPRSFPPRTRRCSSPTPG